MELFDSQLFWLILALRGNKNFWDLFVISVHVILNPFIKVIFLS